MKLMGCRFFVVVATAPACHDAAAASLVSYVFAASCDYKWIKVWWPDDNLFTPLRIHTVSETYTKKGKKKERDPRAENE